ncbi:PKD domain-containing protein, partial [Bacteroidales bacterium OttesenSCG-928-B11]|nr:PKD domain-containing protein [Bacteroidales bacterium OttesenSCG-928-E04]MDL2312825.1 PKD domain-containing protein [Bacteroidales bacterium OttesenSCG-928-B11]MDL2326487.1 PKD domain-containing protein [Bacteroidales bacterium OttesenSCG-928-A14]
VLLSLALLLSTAGCKKELDQLSNSSRKKSIQVPNALMKEPIVQDMLGALAGYRISVNQHGIMVFESAEIAVKVVDVLQHYSDLFEETDYDESYPRDPMLCAFEEAYSFNSLRRSIEEEILYLEEYDMLTDANDPDDHHIASYYMRTVMNPKSTIIFDGLISVLYDDFGVGIMNNDYNALNQLYQIERCGLPNCSIPNCSIPAPYNTPVDRIMEFCNTNPNAFIMSPDGVQCVAEFTMQPDANNPDKIQFVNSSYSEIYQDMQFHWDFGDGQTSTEKDPVHVYSDPGQDFTAVLTVSINGMPPTRELKSGHKGRCTADFTYSKSPSNSQDMKFTCASWAATGDHIVQRYWDFGDGSPVKYGHVVNHTYSQAGSYDVTITTTTSNNQTDLVTKSITVEASSACCKACDKDKSNDNSYSYGNKNYSVKSVLRVTNVWPWHRICSRIVHYEIKSNSKKKEVNTPITGIGAGFEGYIVNALCEDPTEVALGKSVDKKKSRICFDKGFGAHFVFRVQRNALHSSYYVRAKYSLWRLGGVSLHDKPCN